MTGQRWDPERYAREAGFVSELGGPVVELLDPQPGERVLDLGCGDGTLADRIARMGCTVVAVDSSPEQVAAARARGLDARIERAEHLPFREEFDAVFSNAVLHWLRDQEPVLAGVFAALRPGGRFVGELGGEGNVEHIRSALYRALCRRGADPAAADPWFFPSENEYRALLGRAGFEVRTVELFARPTPIPGNLAGWLEIFAQPFLAAVDAGERRDLLDEVQQALAPRLRDRAGGWTVDYARLRFVARKPPAGAPKTS